MLLGMSLQERDFFIEKQEMRKTRLTCTRCRRSNDYQLRWVRRTKKDRLDDVVVCATCRTRFEVPSHQSLVYLHELEGLPKDVEEDEG
jgi:hypothetical protein